MEIEEETKQIIGIYANDINELTNDLLSEDDKEEIETLRDDLEAKLYELLAILGNI